MSQTIVESAPETGLPTRSAAGRVITVASGETVSMSSTRSYQFRHTLGHAPIMSLTAVRDITKRLLDERRFDQIMFDAGIEGWGPKRADAGSGPAILDALDQYGSRRGWLRLTRVDDVAPELGGVVEKFYQDLSELSQCDIPREVVKTFVTLFVSSPGVVTPYHIDHTWNYLLQIQGHKTVHLFDPADPRVLAQAEKEDFYAVGTMPARHDGVSGIAYDLEPGDGVHHPINAPHWVQNGSEVSVSLSLGLCLRQATRDAHVHQVNYVLRRFGFAPPLPREHAWRDGTKAAFIRLISRRTPKTFDNVLRSGAYRLVRVLKKLGMERNTTVKKVEVT
ncbi:cupin-like domain-containing protein [Urbifossiella limnaea]|uniref:JmjC domain-containing protein n=1 Tax=Urbifossiella limnaea TaxID=2528023 RepID=A0A517Y2Y6_9BACT|nr:cupin-like domain-containing protein [Urbifossiella limnaea]QDU24173.1 hypothetical protein ETAA1_61870 [Urbifossiella limnaea]